MKQEFLLLKAVAAKSVFCFVFFKKKPLRLVGIVDEFNKTNMAHLELDKQG